MNTLTQIALMVTGCFVAYLLLCAVVVLRTGSTEGLAAVGAAVAAFITAVVGLIKRWPHAAGVGTPPPPQDGDGNSQAARTDAP